jgi:hypothetical protein
MLHKDYDHKGSVANRKKKRKGTLIMSFNRLGAKMN